MVLRPVRRLSRMRSVTTASQAFLFLRAHNRVWRKTSVMGIIISAWPCEIMLSGILLFHHAEALLLDNTCRDNQHWGLVMTPDTHPTPPREDLVTSNVLLPNPRGSLVVTEQPLADIGR